MAKPQVNREQINVSQDPTRNDDVMQEDTQSKAMTGSERAAAIEQALFDFLQHRMEDPDISESNFLADHSHLMPELREQLQVFQEIENQRDANAAIETVSLVSGEGELTVRCPHCRETVRVSADATFEDITCEGCGSCFSLAGDTRETQPSPTTKQLGHFDLIQQIGVGSFGTVWKAKDSELDRFVAIKIPRREKLDTTEVEQFLREARAAAQLKHPNIVSVLEVGREDDTVFIVSDLVQGVPLSDWLTAHQPTIRDACELCASIADALQHAHDAGIVHRDLKPQNIMLDSENQPHLLDFGLARRSAGEVTMTIDGRVLGTPAYMPPEQARGDAHRVNHQADVYSLGVILFELLTGELPFRGNARMLIHQVLT
ncbi:MAG: serine/threonine protein kinase, partial [Planctomycetales bacterium]|nr:serine/threonine protein kinase [Planctomycetales bacterium]